MIEAIYLQLLITCAWTVDHSQNLPLSHSVSLITPIAAEMPPKSTGKEKASAIQTEEDEALQAVILADSFNKRFTPLTVNQPRVRDSTHML
jgi:translation initiation factor eIF-2B subunit epsilon